MHLLRKRELSDGIANSFYTFENDKTEALEGLKNRTEASWEEILSDTSPPSEDTFKILEHSKERITPYNITQRLNISEDLFNGNNDQAMLIKSSRFMKHRFKIIKYMMA